MSRHRGGAACTEHQSLDPFVFCCTTIVYTLLGLSIQVAASLQIFMNKAYPWICCHRSPMFDFTIPVYKGKSREWLNKVKLTSVRERRRKGILCSRLCQADYAGVPVSLPDGFMNQYVPTRLYCCRQI